MIPNMPKHATLNIEDITDDDNESDMQLHHSFFSPASVNKPAAPEYRQSPCHSEISEEQQQPGARSRLNSDATEADAEAIEQLRKPYGVMDKIVAVLHRLRGRGEDSEVTGRKRPIVATYVGTFLGM